MTFVSLQSVNFPDRVIRHQNFLGELHKKVDLISERDKEDATFDMQEFGGNRVRFSAVNFPSHVLRHQNLRIKLSELRFDISAPGTSHPETPEHRLTREDSIFARVPGLASKGGVSFRATNFPVGVNDDPIAFDDVPATAEFIRHRDFHLFLGPLEDLDEVLHGEELARAERREVQFREDATFFIIEPLAERFRFRGEPPEPR